jgi:hypothetical protein
MKKPATALPKQATGRFEKGRSGNPAGRPPGTRTRATMAAEALLDGESEALTRKAVEMALTGDMGALRLCLERILPPRRERPAVFALPEMQTAGDAVKAMGAVLAAVSDGSLAPGEATDIAKLVENFASVVHTQELEARLGEVEKQLIERNGNGVARNH